MRAMLQCLSPLKFGMQYLHSEPYLCLSNTQRNAPSSRLLCACTALQKRILARMRSLGMTPVLPAFSGFVPAALAQEYPQANITRLPNWGGFPDQYCCVHLLNPLDPLFLQIGSNFVKASPAYRPACMTLTVACDT